MRWTAGCCWRCCSGCGASSPWRVPGYAFAVEERQVAVFRAGGLRQVAAVPTRATPLPLLDW